MRSQSKRDEVARVEYLTAALLNLTETYGEMRVLNRVPVFSGGCLREQFPIAQTKLNNSENMTTQRHWSCMKLAS